MVGNSIASETLYPKITSKIRDVMRNIQALDAPPATTNISFTGTVKLHGIHGDIVFPDSASPDFILQSRNMANLTPERDNQGYAAWMSSIHPEIRSLRPLVLQRFHHLNPSYPPSEINRHPLVLAGEFIGPGLLSGTAVNSLPSLSFVIISISIAGRWQNDADYASIHSESAKIYHISRGGFFHATLDISTPSPSLEGLYAHMRSVAQRCPFALSFGVRGIGEGIVWKPYSGPESRVSWPPEFWLKTKAPEFWTSQRVVKVPGEKLAGNQARGAAFARQVVTERRLEQGLEWLEEMGRRVEIRELGAYLEWLWRDVEAEEGAEMKEMGIRESAVKIEVGRMGASWFKNMVESGKGV